MIVGMRAARALGERRLPKFLFPTLPHPHEDQKNRRDDRTDSEKETTSTKLNEIVGVMKDSANHLVARSQTLAHDPREQERVSFFQWMLEFTSRMPCQNWREFQKQAFTMACAYTPTDSPQGHQSRPQISQEASTSSSQAHHGQQYPMNPPARLPSPGAGGFLELLQSQTNEMVSNFFLVILLMLNSRKSFFAQWYVMFANCH